MQPSKKTEEDHPRAQACHASLTSPVLGHLSIPRNYLRYGTRLTWFKTSQKLGRPRDVTGMAADVKSLRAARHLPTAPPANAGQARPSPCGRALASSRIADGCAWCSRLSETRLRAP